MSHAYSSRFFDYIERGARRSASVIVPLVDGVLKAKSVLDVGCGRGVWLLEWSWHGAVSVAGVDGFYIEREDLAIPPACFDAKDLSKPFDLGRQFDLVQCLEVAEHIAGESSQTLVENLVRHSAFILFSAAVPGQGGEWHVNEQPLEFWRSLFKEFEYVPFDFVRKNLVSCDAVEPWYRYNTLLYVRGDRVHLLPQAVADTRVPDGVAISELGSWSWRLRRALLRKLSIRVVTRLSIFRYKFLTAFAWRIFQ